VLGALSTEERCTLQRLLLQALEGQLAHSDADADAR